MDLNFGNLVKISNDLIETQEELKQTFNSIEIELENVSSNIVSSGLSNANAVLIENINDIAADLTSLLNMISTFVKKQINDYIITEEETLTRINKLINIITMCIDEKGNFTDYNYYRAELLSSTLMLFDGSSGEDIISELLALYGGSLIKIDDYTNLGSVLYEKLDLAKAGYESGEEFIIEIINLAKSSASTNREKVVFSVIAFANLVGENGLKADYDWGGGHHTFDDVTMDTLSKGVDCSSFVSWGVQQGAVNDFDTSTTYGLINKGTKIDDITAVQPGDYAVYNNYVGVDENGNNIYKGHTVFILENRPGSNEMVVAEAHSSGAGIIVRTMTYEEFYKNGYQFRDMSEYYNE